MYMRRYIISNGTTGGPSFGAVCARAGWSMGNTKDRYIKNMEAGDQVVGRTVAELNSCTVYYIVSPPFFDVHVAPEDSSDYNENQSGDVDEDELLATDVHSRLL
jgi:hypothetical protein